MVAWWSVRAKARRFQGPRTALSAVTGDLPVDVRDTLAQLFAEAGKAARERRTETALAALSTAATVVENKVPESDRKRQLIHGCERAQATATDEPLVAAEYCEAMHKRL
jgi:hypothetical protein